MFDPMSGFAAPRTVGFKDTHPYISECLSVHRFVHPPAAIMPNRLMIGLSMIDANNIMILIYISFIALSLSYGRVN